MIGRVGDDSPGARRDLKQRVDVDLFGHRRRQPVDAVGGRVDLVGRDQAEVALGDLERGVALDRAEHGDVGIALERGAQLALVARPADLVEDHAGDAHLGIEVPVAENQRRDAAGHAHGIDHQHHRRAQQPRKRGVAVAALGIDAVEQSLVALDHGETGIARLAGEQRADLGLAHGVEVEVEARPPARLAEPDRIDVVGALLERLRREAAFSERRQKAHRQRRLAR